MKILDVDNFKLHQVLKGVHAGTKDDSNDDGHVCELIVTMWFQLPFEIVTDVCQMTGADLETVYMSRGGKFFLPNTTVFRKSYIFSKSPTKPRLLV